MSSNKKQSKNKIILVCIIVLAVLISLYYFKSKNPSVPPTGNTGITVDKNSINYGAFITGEDNSYFLTKDNTVKSIITKYLAKQASSQVADTEKYGYSLVYYYDNEKFIEAQKTYSTDDKSINSFILKDIKTGQYVNNSCIIFAKTGSYRDSSILMSGSSRTVGASGQEGVCIYEKGAANTTFIDLSSKLLATETIFKDPSGQNISTTIKNVDTNKRTFEIDVFSTVKKDSNGNNIYVKSLQLSY